MYWNVRSVKQREIELKKILINIDIFECVETWLKSDDHFEIPGFITVRQDRAHTRGGGILYLIRNSFKHEIISEATSISENIELLGIRMLNTTPTMNFATCYRVPGDTLTQKEWNEIGNTTDFNSNSILLGDFNAHNKKWNGKKTDTNGERLEYTLDLENLFINTIMNLVISTSQFLIRLYCPTFRKRQVSLIQGL